MRPLTIVFALPVFCTLLFSALPDPVGYVQAARAQSSHADYRVEGHSKDGPEPDIDFSRHPPDHANPPSEVRRKVISARIHAAAHVQDGFPDKRFGMLTCKLTVKPDGAIGDLEIYKSSGSDETDKMAINLIKLAAPFDQGPDSKDPFKVIRRDLCYLVEFPFLRVTRHREN